MWYKSGRQLWHVGYFMYYNNAVKTYLPPSWFNFFITSSQKCIYLIVLVSTITYTALAEKNNCLKAMYIYILGVKSIPETKSVEVSSWNETGNMLNLSRVTKKLLWIHNATFKHNDQSFDLGQCSRLNWKRLHSSVNRQKKKSLKWNWLLKQTLFSVALPSQ